MNEIDEQIEEIKMMLKEVSIFLTLNWADWLGKHKEQYPLLYSMIDDDVIKLMK